MRIYVQKTLCMCKRALYRIRAPLWYRRAATHCNTLQHTATHHNTLHDTATHCNTLQHGATHSNTLQHLNRTRVPLRYRRVATYCNMQHTATHCNTLQHTATHCNTLQHLNRTRVPLRLSIGRLSINLCTRMNHVKHINESCHT